jgi:dihydrolipoamide dehydrogenase
MLQSQKLNIRRFSTSGEQQDLVVIGGGPGGYVAAIKAAQLGLKVGHVSAIHPSSKLPDYLC